MRPRGRDRGRRSVGPNPWGTTQPMRHSLLPALAVASALAIGGCLHAPMPWSPDGKWLAYTVEVRPIGQILRPGWLFESADVEPPTGPSGPEAGADLLSALGDPGRLGGLGPAGGVARPADGPRLEPRRPGPGVRPGRPRGRRLGPVRGGDPGRADASAGGLEPGPAGHRRRGGPTARPGDRLEPRRPIPGGPPARPRRPGDHPGRQRPAGQRDQRRLPPLLVARRGPAGLLRPGDGRHAPLHRLGARAAEAPGRGRPGRPGPGLDPRRPDPDGRRPASRSPGRPSRPASRPNCSGSASTTAWSRPIRSLDDRRRPRPRPLGRGGLDRLRPRGREPLLLDRRRGPAAPDQLVPPPRRTRSTRSSR